MRLRNAPLRVATGAYILQQGLEKRTLEGQAVEGLHGMAAGAIPQLQKVPPATFGTALSTTEIALGAALLSPFVSPVLAGAALTGFGAGLMQLYVNTPGLHQEGSLKPTPDGLGIAKDVWLVGIGTSLVLGGIADGVKGAFKGLRGKR